ncbi:hypothetical protein [Streptomyces sp. rh206]|uniref:hypothetical protein n=1 Tax=Streptomyces sp. rh206 TaxID=2034270 RepID=UPI00359C5422
MAAGRATAALLAAAPDTPEAGGASAARTVRAAATRLLAAIDRHACPACAGLPPRGAQVR